MWKSLPIIGSNIVPSACHDLRADFLKKAIRHVTCLMTVKAIVHPAEEGGYWAEVPSLPGCFTQADTLDDLKVRLAEAIEGWFLADAEQEIEDVDAQPMLINV